MTKEYPAFSQIKTIILSVTVFLFPLFFLPFTQDFFVLNKMYLLAIAALALILVSVVEVFVTKRIVWQQNKVDKAIILFCLTVALSTFISSPNKVQALLNGNFGLVATISLAIISFYIVRSTEATAMGLKKLFLFSTGIAALVAIFFYFTPFKNAHLSLMISFLKTPYFNTVGTLIDISALLGFAFVIIISHFIHNKKAQTEAQRKPALTYGILAVITISLLLSVYGVVKPILSKQGTLPYPPFRLSWAAAVDTLKNPVNAAFGIGPDNFGALFTHEKDIVYNQSPQWQISTFSVSRSGILQIVTEGGLLSLIAFALIVLVAYKQITENPSKQTRIGLGLPLAYAVALLLFLPPSLILMFIFFIAVAYTAHFHGIKNQSPATLIDATSIAPIYIGLSIAGLVVVVIASYFLGRVYLAEYNFHNAVVANAQGDLQKVYDNHVNAILLNPYIEGYRISFSQVNMYIANSIANKAQQDANKAAGIKDNEKNAAVKLTDQQKQGISDRIQVAISESKAAVALNPNKAVNWENLAVLYRNLIAVAQGAGDWTVSSYQRAIAIDPSNPIYRINLGGVYYSAADYNDAQNLFSQAASLKPDWPNAYYNLAWASFQKKDYQQAIAAMQKVISLVDPKKDAADYQRATKDLEQFQAAAPKDQTQQQTTNGAQNGQAQLALPTPPVASVEPKIQLPNTASPEAQTGIKTTPTIAPTTNP
jgi:cytochrome c-type biogenesis protein CcmH/NrfG